VPFEDGCWLEEADCIAELFHRPTADDLQSRGQHSQRELVCHGDTQGFLTPSIRNLKLPSQQQDFQVFLSRGFTSQAQTLKQG
jgi:hypothetical protein